MVIGYVFVYGSGKILFEVGEMCVGNVVFLIDVGIVGWVFEGEMVVED